jgi:hypothetical protein
MKIELLKEPNLEFGNDFICDDPKIGITLGGFFSLTNQSHKSEIHYSVIGTQANIEDAIKWINVFDNFIEASGEAEERFDESLIEDGEVVDFTDEGELFHTDYSFLNTTDERQEQVEQATDVNTKVNKKRNPDFPGFNNASQIKCSFLNDESNNKELQLSKVREILKDTVINNFDKAIKVCDLYIQAYEYVLTKSITRPTVCFIIIPSEVYKKLSSIRYAGHSYFNLRRYLKAQLIVKSQAIPVQIILEDTITQKRKSLQDLSMQAWNFCVANYYKSSSIPWTLTLKDKHTCFIGISFHKVLNADKNTLRSSVSQAFNYEGKGLIFVGEHFEWDDDEMETPAPHLTYEYANRLITQVIEEYKAFNKNLPPRRVVIHKTTSYWDSAVNKDYAEVEGLKNGIKEVLGDEVQIDLVAVKSTDIKLLRESGQYPVMRGTLLHIDDASGILYTTGYIPYYETFPSMAIPRPLEISIYEQESSLKKICEEILALTKLNFNNCNYYDSLPITIRFAQKVGEITQYIEPGIKPPDRYYFYM